MNVDLLAMCTVVGVAVAILVDGRFAVAIACLAASLGVAPTVAHAAGAVSAMGMIGTGIATLALLLGAQQLAFRARFIVGLDPVVPMFSPPLALFGPRSARVAVAALSIPIASWLSFNVPLAGVAGVEGLLFSGAYAWLCGVGRLLIARTLEDVGVGIVLLTIGTATAWLLRDGEHAQPEAAALLILPLVVGAVAGWLSGRHGRERSP